MLRRRRMHAKGVDNTNGVVALQMQRENGQRGGKAEEESVKG